VKFLKNDQICATLCAHFDTLQRLADIVVSSCRNRIAEPDRP
jgi:hypothetical protein